MLLLSIIVNLASKPLFTDWTGGNIFLTGVGARMQQELCLALTPLPLVSGVPPISPCRNDKFIPSIFSHPIPEGQIVLKNHCLISST